MTTPSFRDVEQLSAYLDGQLSQAERARLDARIESDHGLAAALDELRQTRALLRRAPHRRAPRNFTLTPKMAGIRPPIPRLVPAFRWASVVATILVFLTLAGNLLAPIAAAPKMAAEPYGGMGGVGGGPAENAQPSVDMTVTPTPEGMTLLAPQATPEPGARTVEPPSAPPQQTMPIFTPFQIGLMTLAIVSGGIAITVRVKAERDWSKANAITPRKIGIKDFLLFLLVVLAILVIGAGIYWLSTPRFHAPAPQPITYSSGLDDKGSGDEGFGNKGSGTPVGAQDFSLTPGMGYNFSAVDARGLITAIEFPADAVKEETAIHFIPGLDTIPPNGLYFADRAFTVFPTPKSMVLQAPVTITMDYGEDVSTTTDGTKLVLYWWSGNDWRDAATTCDPVSTYERMSERNRLRVSVCELGTFLLFAP